jgi:HAD superfamily hydrolase (TIGR01490 family)
MRLTLFDLDHTLLDGDSNLLWLTWLVERGEAPPERLAQQDTFYAQYQAGTLDIDAYLAFHLSLLVGPERSHWEAVRAAFVADRIAPLIGPAARDAVAQHRADGDLIAVVTATHAFLAQGIVSLLAPMPLVATGCELEGGRFTGRPIGGPCFAGAKFGQVQAWLHADGHSLADFDAVRFYSDSANDLPLLDAVSEPVVVNADPRLSAIARERGWPQLQWRRTIYPLSSTEQQN